MLLRFCRRFGFFRNQHFFRQFVVSYVLLAFLLFRFGGFRFSFAAEYFARGFFMRLADRLLLDWMLGIVFVNDGAVLRFEPFGRREDDLLILRIEFDYAESE